MTLTPQHTRKQCFIPCSPHKVKVGRCDCINRVRQINENQVTPRHICSMKGKGYCPFETKDGGCKYDDKCSNKILKQ